MRSPTARRRPIALLALVGAVVAFALPAVASAHPLGNFTINHYAALRVGADGIALDVVVDFAEIPAFQERIRIDRDGDGSVTDEEADAARAPECAALVPDLALVVDGARQDLTLLAAGLSFPAGAGGVPTMRIVCEFEAGIAVRLTDGAVVTFGDGTFEDRIGWREIVVYGDGVTISPVEGRPGPGSGDVSARLTGYPASLLTQPLDVRSVEFTVAAGGPPLPPFAAPDAEPLGGSVPSPAPSAGGGGPLTSPTPGAADQPASVPGGVGAEIPDIFQAADLTPIVALGSILLAMALGAGHALTPGHGKTLMAAYLVGTRGTIRHAAGLGLAVTVSHTIGILLLALLVTGAEAALPADLVVRAIPVVAALAFVAIGGWMVIGEVRARRRARGAATAHDHEHQHEREHGHTHEREHGHTHEREHGHADADSDAPGRPIGEHSHGGMRHSHLPADDRTITWRSLFAIGLAGGIIPSTNALIILLGTIVAGRAAFGIVLVVAFGLGMAIVLGGVGAVMVLARERLERLPSHSTLGTLAGQAPLLASVAVLGIGLWLTAQALGGAAVF